MNTEGTVGTALPGAAAAAVAVGEAAIACATPLVGGVVPAGATAGLGAA